MVDDAQLAKNIADIRDAVARIREVLPQEAEEFLATARSAKSLS